jgi:enoyl-[acyl-carrier protein] reductase III
MSSCSMTDRFRGHVAIVTGGSKGVGRAIALRLAAEGASVGITWFRDRVSAEKTIVELEETGARVHSMKAHLGNPDVPSEVMNQMKDTLGDVTLLVSNAASGTQRPLAEIQKSHWDWTMETNAAALLRLVQSVNSLKSIVALTSLGSTRVLPGYGVVGASKAALETLVRYLAVEHAASCRVNAISAGVIDTESLRRFPAASDLLYKAENSTPAGRLVTPNDVAALAAFLLSEEAGMITGQTITIDGGYSLIA